VSNFEYHEKGELLSKEEMKDRLEGNIYKGLSHAFAIEKDKDVIISSENHDGSHALVIFINIPEGLNDKGFREFYYDFCAMSFTALKKLQEQISKKTYG
jgi:hypothetical protein